jgi:hypothetical protein
VHLVVVLLHVPETREAALATLARFFWAKVHRWLAILCALTMDLTAMAFQIGLAAELPGTVATPVPLFVFFLVASTITSQCWLYYREVGYQEWRKMRLRIHMGTTAWNHAVKSSVEGLTSNQRVSESPPRCYLNTRGDGNCIVQPVLGTMATLCCSRLHLD